jgi:hypothetical protein
VGTSQFRHWDSARADWIYKLYGVTPTDRINYTLDHLVPLEIGGADVVENLWPEPRRSLAGEWDDTRKDQSSIGWLSWCAPASSMRSKRKGKSPRTGPGPLQEVLPRARDAGCWSDDAAMKPLPSEGMER